VTMQVFVRGYCTMIAAPVQCDVDGIPKGSHYVLLERANQMRISFGPRAAPAQYYGPLAALMEGAARAEHRAHSAPPSAACAGWAAPAHRRTYRLPCPNKASLARSRSSMNCTQAARVIPRVRIRIVSPGDAMVMTWVRLIT
jgi:hypothetical protein